MKISPNKKYLTREGHPAFVKSIEHHGDHWFCKGYREVAGLKISTIWLETGKFSDRTNPHPFDLVEEFEAHKKLKLDTLYDK